MFNFTYYMNDLRLDKADTESTQTVSKLIRGVWSGQIVYGKLWLLFDTDRVDYEEYFN